MRAEWVRAWCRAFGGDRFTVLTARRGGELVGVAPLLQLRSTLASPTNYHSPEYGFLAADRDAADDLAAAALRGVRRAVVLSFVDSAGETGAAHRRAARQARHLFVTRTLECPPYVATEGSWREYEARQSAKLLRDLRRRERRLAELGTPSFHISDGSSDFDELLTDCFRTEAASWKGAQGTAMISASATRLFYTEIARWARTRGELLLAFLRLDGYPIAAMLNLNAGGTLTGLKLGYDEAYARFSPSKLLLRHVLRHCFEGSITSYDFSGHADAYKMEWADSTRTLIETRSFARNPAGVASWGWWRFGRPLARRLAGRGTW